MRRPITLLLASAAALVATAAALATAAWADDPLPSLAGSEWGFADSQDAYVKFLETDVSGFSGCNRFRGTYTFADGRLTFGPLASTRMACPPEQMDTERRVLGLLDATKSATATHKTLTLQDGTGAPLATLPRRDWD